MIQTLSIFICSLSWVDEHDEGYLFIFFFKEISADPGQEGNVVQLLPTVFQKGFKLET